MLILTLFRIAAHFKEMHILVCHLQEHNKIVSDILQKPIKHRLNACFLDF